MRLFDDPSTRRPFRGGSTETTSNGASMQGKRRWSYIGHESCFPPQNEPGPIVRSWSTKHWTQLLNWSTTKDVLIRKRVYLGAITPSMQLSNRSLPQLSPYYCSPNSQYVMASSNNPLNCSFSSFTSSLKIGANINTLFCGSVPSINASISPPLNPIPCKPLG